MIRIEQLSFTYEGSEKKALDDVSLTIEDGDFVGVIGASGAGKSTLTYAINGVIPHHFKGHYYGHVYVNEKDVFDTSLTEISRLIGTVFQDIDSQMVSTIVEDEMLYGLENFGVPKEEMDARLTEALAAAGIPELRGRDISSLSGGQKQKVAVAAILALKPQILLLDEPTGELDPKSSRQIFSVLQELNKNYGITVVIVEQKIMLLCEFVTKLVVMERGRILCSGGVREVLAHSEQLEQAGVQCPRVVTFGNLLKEKGIGTGKLAVDLDEAQELVEEIARGISTGDQNDDARCAETKTEELRQTAETPLIAFRDVTFSYGDGSASIDHIGFQIHAGEFVAIVGENGAGKSTTSKLMNGLLKPQSGTVTIDGMDTRNTKVSALAASLGFLFQNPDRQLCCKTVAEEIAFSLDLTTQLSDEEKKTRVADVLALFELDGEADPFSMSRGEKQRVALASVLVLQPKILILDEPTTGLDYRECTVIMEFVKQLNRLHGTTVVMVCHDMEVVFDYAKRVIAMAGGRIVDDAPTDQIFRRKETVEKASIVAPQMIALSMRLGGAFAHCDTAADFLAVLTADRREKAQNLCGEPEQTKTGEGSIG